ncbi:MAG TPA: SDR family NAD(P)-dependent oxidoreductase [Candidatus Binatia bacterium]|nr:SDR family NAD(P)-dependent oxidoreductase [Candidatus Binatia bacterium]
MKLAGKTAFITGGSRGIGRGIALAFAREGADVAINFRRDRSAAEATAADVAALGRRSEIYQADVGDADAVARAIEAAAARFGGFDVLVANSGVASRTAPVAETEVDYWKRVLDVDLNGVFYTCRYGVPRLRPRGSVIVVSSIGADLCAAYGAPYYVAKAGANALTKVLAKELAPDKKRVNCIAPGMIATDMGNRLMAALGGESMISTIPLGRIGQPEDIGAAAVFLASEDASWITGKILRVDGGVYM